MLGSSFDLGEAIATIAAKRDLEQQRATERTAYSDFDTKLRAFVDALTQDGSANGIFTTPLDRRDRKRL